MRPSTRSVRVAWTSTLHLVPRGGDTTLCGTYVRRELPCPLGRVRLCGSCKRSAQGTPPERLPHPWQLEVA